MTSPFDKNFKGSIDLTEASRLARMSKTRSRQRAKMLKSDDPEQRRNAQAAVGPLSKRTKK